MKPTFESSRTKSLVAVFCFAISLFSNHAAHGQEKNRKKPKVVVNYRSPERAFEKVTIDDRVFIVEKQLLVEDSATARKALARLKFNIDLALSILPPHSHEQVAKQQFWLLYGKKAKGGGRDSGLAYFRPGSPKFDANRHEEWNSVVVVYHANNYVSLTDLWALKSVLHELAHAYQLEQWPEKEPNIMAAYENAMADGLYQDVRNNKGGRFKPAYAASNQLEYFAEVSCMFFAKCNYEPFNRAELRQIDPSGYNMLRKVWKIGDAHGKHEERVWKIGRSGRPVRGTLKSLARKRVTLIDPDGQEKAYTLTALSSVDRDYVKRWFEE